MSSPNSTSAALQALRYDHRNIANANTGDVPPISEWEEILIGKKYTKEDAEGDENVSLKRDDSKSYERNAMIKIFLKYRIAFVDIQTIRLAETE